MFIGSKLGWSLVAFIYRIFPYVTGVAKILTEEGKVNDLVLIQVAMLHDTMEDTDTHVSELVENFGAEVNKSYKIINNLPDNSKLVILAEVLSCTCRIFSGSFLCLRTNGQQKFQEICTETYAN